mgnify:CR=1 FL=1
MEKRRPSACASTIRMRTAHVVFHPNNPISGARPLPPLQHSHRHISRLTKPNVAPPLPLLTPLVHPAGPPPPCWSTLRGTLLESLPSVNDTCRYHRFGELEEAKRACERTPTCGGINRDDGLVWCTYLSKRKIRGTELYFQRMPKLYILSTAVAFDAARRQSESWILTRRFRGDAESCSAPTLKTVQELDASRRSPPAPPSPPEPPSHPPSPALLNAACITGVARGISVAWPSFVTNVAPQLHGIFIEVADSSGCSEQVLKHPKILAIRVVSEWVDLHASHSIEAIQQHAAREASCLQLIASQPTSFDRVLLTRPDVLYPEPFPFDALPPTPRVVYIPLGDDAGNGVNDQMAVGSLSTLVSQSGWGVGARPSIGPETVFGEHLLSQGVEVKRFWFEYAVLRRRDIAVARAVGVEVFVAFNHNLRVWTHLNSNPVFDTGANTVPSKTRCTVTSEGHTQPPPYVSCTRERIPFSCKRDGPKNWTAVVCSDEISLAEAEAALCYRKNVSLPSPYYRAHYRPQMEREMVFRKSCPHRTDVCHIQR